MTNPVTSSLDITVPDPAKVVIQDIRAALPSLLTIALQNRMELDKVAGESARHGGVTTFIDAVKEFMFYEKTIGVRQMALYAGIKRIHLQQMLDGTREMTGDVTSKLTEFLEKHEGKSF